MKKFKTIKNSNVVRKFTIATLLIFISTITSAALLVKITQKGTAAYLTSGSYTANGYYYHVQVNQEGYDQNKKTFVYYYILKDLQLHKFWSGYVPNSAFTGAGTSTLNFKYNTCDVTANESCGLLDITWKANGNFSTHTSGITKTVVQDLIHQTHGSRSYNHADVFGTILGVDLSTQPAITATMGTDHNVTHTISKGAN